jgi:hypothetical protein
MAKQTPPSSWSRDPAKAPAPGRRARGAGGRTSCRPVTDDELLQTLQRRHPDQDTTGFSLFDFIHALGSPLDALLYSALFWPELVEVDGAILSSDAIEDEADLVRIRAIVRERGAVETEKRFNLREFSDLFGNGLAEIDDRQAEALLGRLAEMWRGRLAARFPGRRFAVDVWQPDETGGDIGIVFYQAEPSRQ